jgi:hypothetical protein
MGSTFFTRQLLRQSAATVPVDMLVEDDLLAVHQRALDLAALHGAGTATEPQGIYGATGVNSVAINGNPTYAQLVSMITPIAEANGDVSRLAYMTTPRVATKLMVTEIFPGTPSGSPVWSGTVADGRVAGYRAGATNQVSSTLAADGVGPTPTPLSHHGLILGDWPGMTIGEWGMVELIADPYTRKKRGIIEVTSFQMVDIQLVRPELFTVGTGVLIS